MTTCRLTAAIQSLQPFYSLPCNFIWEFYVTDVYACHRHIWTYHSLTYQRKIECADPHPLCHLPTLIDDRYGPYRLAKPTGMNLLVSDQVLDQAILQNLSMHHSLGGVFYRRIHQQ